MARREFAFLQFTFTHRDDHALETLTLALVPEWAVSSMKIEWRATAANTRGMVTSNLAIAIPGGD